MGGLRYVVNQPKEAWKATRYLLFDNSRPVKPIWIVALPFVLTGIVIYVVWPNLIYTFLALILVYMIVLMIYKLIRRLIYTIKYVRRSAKKEGKVYETILSEPPHVHL